MAGGGFASSTGGVTDKFNVGGEACAYWSQAEAPFPAQYCHCARGLQERTFEPRGPERRNAGPGQLSSSTVATPYPQIPSRSGEPFDLRAAREPSDIHEASRRPFGPLYPPGLFRAGLAT